MAGDVAMGGGAGGGAADFWTNLGDLLHKNTNQSVGIIGGLRNQQKQMEIQEDQFNRTLEETKRQNSINNMMGQRNQNMNALDMLANQRYNAMNAFRGQQFKDALHKAFGG